MLGIINPVAGLKLVTLERKRQTGEDKRNLEFCSLHRFTSFLFHSTVEARDLQKFFII